MILKYNNRVVTHNDRWVSSYDPYNPLSLPHNTIRMKFNNGVIPATGSGSIIAQRWSSKQISVSPNIWDITFNDSNWSGSRVLSNDTKKELLEVLGAETKDVTDMNGLFNVCKSLTKLALFNTHNVTTMQEMFSSDSLLVTVPLFDTSNVTNMSNMFYWCTSLKEVPVFDTSKVITMQSMFSSCDSLTKVPLFNTDKVTNVQGMFLTCYKVESGALALYNQMSTQAIPPAYHNNCFFSCGRNTTTGLAELNQIPSSWGGLANG